MYGRLPDGTFANARLTTGEAMYKAGARLDLYGVLELDGRRTATFDVGTK
jgi:hypothetical protein